MNDRRSRSGRASRGPRSARPFLEGLEDRRLLTIAFHDPVHVEAGQGPQGLVLADFNGDSKLDLAIAQTSSNDVSVRLGLGDGSFGMPSLLVAGSDPVAIASADLNGDSKLDLVVGNYSSENLTVFLGKGDGTFGSGTDFGGKPGTRGLTIADLNGDSKPDLIAASQSNPLVALFGNGDGTFGAAVTIDDQYNPNDVVAADLDADGDLDLAGASHGAAVVYLNNGSGSFAAPTIYMTQGTGSTDLTIGDFNNDGKPDILQSSSNHAMVSLFRNQGDGKFSAALNFAVGPQNTMPFGVVARDFDDDGKLDVVTAVYGGVSVLAGRGNGTFDPFASIPFQSGTGQVEAGDLNGDGKLDLVATNYGSNSYSVLLAFTPGVPLPTLAIGDVQVTEGDQGTSNATFTVTLSEASATAVTLKYSTTQPGFPPPGENTVFKAASGTLTFEPGQTSATFPVPVIGDLVYEGNQSFSVYLSEASGATIADGKATGTVVENDPLPTVSVVSGSAIEGQTGTPVLVTLSNPSAFPISVPFAVIGGTATAGTDFTRTAGTVNFAPGETSRTLDLAIVDDLRIEASETILLELGSPTGATIGNTNTATFTTLDNEALPDFQISVTSPAIEGGGFATITVTRSDPSTEGAALTYNTFDGRFVTPVPIATPGLDYAATGGTLTFAVGEGSRTIQIPILDDAEFEPDEFFGLAYSIVAPADRIVLAVFWQITAKIQDNDPPPPALVTVKTVSTQVQKGVIKALLVTFSGDVDPARAIALANYQLVSEGKDRRFGTKDDKITRFRSSTYNPLTHTVMLIPKGKLKLTRPQRLSVMTSGVGGLTDQLARKLDGDRNGSPGGDDVILVGGKTR